LSYFHEALGLKISGIDYSPAGVTATQDNLARQGIKSEIIEGDYLSYTFSSKFDVIVSFGVVEHYTRPALIIEKCFEDLRKGGVCFCAVPNFESALYARLQRAVDNGVWERHVVLGLNELELLLRRAGFAEVSGSYFGSFGLGVVNISRFHGAEPLYFSSNLLLHLFFKGVLGRRESPLLAPYIIAWGLR
jgi:SAM-dependent methyltransferase